MSQAADDGRPVGAGLGTGVADADRQDNRQNAKRVRGLKGSRVQGFKGSVRSVEWGPASRDLVGFGFWGGTEPASVALHAAREARREQ